MNNNQNHVTLHVDLPFEDHDLMKRGASLYGIDNDAVKFPNYISNQVTIEGTSSDVFRILAILRLYTPLAVYIDLPVGFSNQQVLYILDAFNRKNNIQLRPLWSGLAFTIQLLAIQEHRSNFTEVIFDILQLLEYIGVHDPLVYSSIRIEAVNRFHILREIERLESHGNGDTSIIIPPYMGCTDTNSVFSINGPPDDVLDTRQRLIGYLPLRMIFDFNYDTFDEDFIKSIAEQYNITICSSSENVCMISCSEMYSDRMFYAHELMMKFQHEKNSSNEETEEIVD